MKQPVPAGQQFAQFYTPMGGTTPQVYNNPAVQSAAILNRQQKIANRLAQYHWKLPSVQPTPVSVPQDTFGKTTHHTATTNNNTVTAPPTATTPAVSTGGGKPKKTTTWLKKLQAYWLPLSLVSAGSVGVGAVAFHYVPQWLGTKQPEQPQGTAAEVSQAPLNTQWQQEAASRAATFKQSVDTTVGVLQQLNPTALKDRLNTLPVDDIKGGGYFGVAPLAEGLLVRFPLPENTQPQTPLFQHFDTITTPKIVLVEYPPEMAEKLAPFAHILGTPIAAIVDSSLSKYTATGAVMSIADATNPYKNEHKQMAGILPLMPGVPLASQYSKAFEGLEQPTGNLGLNANPELLNECDQLVQILRHLYTDSSYSLGNRQWLLNDSIQRMMDCVNDTDPTKTLTLNAGLVSEALQ